MGSDFVLGYIQALDGEKDPRNLIIGFNSVFTIVRHLPFGEWYVGPTNLQLLWQSFPFIRGAGRRPV